MKLRMPHTMVLLLAVMVLALVVTWLLPPGAYQTAQTATGAQLIVPGTFAPLPERTYLPPWAILTAIPRALASVQGIVFFILLVGGVFGVVRHTEAIEAGIGRTFGLFQHRQGLLVFMAMAMFAVLSASFGMASEYIPFVAVLVALCAAVRLDAMTAASILLVGYGVGYGASTTNPFTVFIAQDIAGVPLGSGLWFRAVVLAVALLIGFQHVWSYVLRVRRDPSLSLTAAPELAPDAPSAPPVAEAMVFPAMTTTRRLVLAALGVTIAALIAGIVVGHWQLPQLSALFLGLGLAAALIARIPADDACRAFIAGASRMTGVAILVGFARAIGLILEDGQVLHTLVEATAAPLGQIPREAAAVAMLAIQSLLNIVIPSGSGQALATMPIMAPIADVVGVSRQVSVLAFQFGDGFTNLLLPTNPFLMAILGLAGVSYGQWARLMWPLLVKLMLLSALAVVVAVQIGL